MKNNIILRFVSLIVCICMAAALTAQTKGGHVSRQPKKLTTVVLDKAAYDFGRIMEKDGKTSRTITLANKGGKPVAISDVRTFCGCAAPTFTKQAIRPGQTGKVTITYDPYNHPGKFTKDIYILLNDGKNYVETKITGEVVPFLHPITEDHPYAFGEGLYMGMKLLPFANQGTGVRQTVQLRIANDTKKKMTVEFRRQPDNRVLRMPERVELQPLERTIITASYAYPKAYTYDRHIWLRITVNGKPAKPMKVVFYGTKNVLHLK